MKKLTAVLAMVAECCVFCLLLAPAAEAKRLPWCGIYMNQYFGLSKRSLWVARNWAGEGAAAGGPQIGAVVVWRHHVGVIAGPPDARGRWLVHSGNDGNAVRTRYRSLRGAIAFRHVGTKMASQNFNLEIQQHAAASGDQNLTPLRAERRRGSVRLREARATAEVARVPVAELANPFAVAEPARLTRKGRPQQVAAVSESTGMFFTTMVLNAEPVRIAPRERRSLRLSHRHAPRTDLAQAEHHPNSRALQRWASHTPHDTRSPGSVAHGLAFGAGEDLRGFPSPAARRGYRR